ncbi:hypothetical protein [Mycobacteroides saopaulense]|uniref:hypothetical protein n=1 Tax=Mycobacteroides saopaulense TaxID=1578165 RepID=UPI0012FF89BA|nr:hypothetical protein [Mycobacteroides saopaulense]
MRALRIGGAVAAATTGALLLMSCHTVRPPEAPRNVRNAPGDMSCAGTVESDPDPGGPLLATGQLLLPVDTLPNLKANAYKSFPLGSDVTGLQREVAEHWMTSVDIGTSRFPPDASAADQATAAMRCLADCEWYRPYSPRLGPIRATPMKVDGVPAYRVDAVIRVNRANAGVDGDDTTVVMIRTDPVTFFMGTSPIGDAHAHADVEKALGALRITKL